MDFRTFAIQTAKAAGEILMRRYGELHTLEWMTLTNFRTEVDLESGNFIRGEIERVFPDHDFYFEDVKAKTTGSKRRWIVDELDGTLPYATGINDHFSISIALLEDEVPILGVIYAPKRGELYVGERGQGAFLNDKPIRVSTETDVNHVLMGLDSGKEGKDFSRLELVGPYQKLLGKDGIACDLKHGCASVPLMLVASGRLHAYCAMWLEIEDTAAAEVILPEAGAIVTRLDGRKRRLGDRSILAANPVLHAKLLERIR